MSNYPTVDELTRAIENATEHATKDLFAQYSGEHFYYFSLITTGEALPPVIAAWSEETLEDVVKDEVDKEDARWGLKWSYADSPFLDYGAEHFEEAKKLFALRPDIRKLDSLERQAEYELRLRGMEAAMSNLDRRGVFGVGEERSRIVINVEVMPPDVTNTERAKRLNPPDAIKTWLNEAAESE